MNKLNWKLRPCAFGDECWEALVSYEPFVLYQIIPGDMPPATSFHVKRTIGDDEDGEEMLANTAQPHLGFGRTFTSVEEAKQAAEQSELARLATLAKKAHS